MQPQTRSFQAFVEIFGSLTRWLAAILAVLYASGFVVVNTYLGTFGVHDLEPLRTRYVAAGILFLALAALAAMFGVRTSDFIAARLGAAGWAPTQVFLLSLVSVPVIAVVVTLIILAVLSYLRVIPVPLGQADSLVRLIDVAAFGLAATLAVITARARRADWQTLLGVLQAAVYLTTFTWGLIGYANTIYPALPFWLGGGMPDEVRLVVDDMATVCPLCGASSLKLLDDDGQRVVVLIDLPDGTRVAVEIARSAIRSITHSSVAPRHLP